MEKNFTETQTQQVFQREIRIDFKSMSFIYMRESQPLKKGVLQSFIGKLCTMKIFNVYLFAHYLSNKRHLRMLKRYQTYIKYFNILIFTDTSCIQIIQYFLPVKILCISKKKNWQTLDPAPIFEISIRIFVRCKIRGERKTHRMGNK